MHLDVEDMRRPLGHVSAMPDQIVVSISLVHVRKELRHVWRIRSRGTAEGLQHRDGETGGGSRAASAQENGAWSVKTDYDGVAADVRERERERERERRAREKSIGRDAGGAEGSISENKTTKKQVGETPERMGKECCVESVQDEWR